LVRQAQELIEKLRSDHIEERQEAARKLKDLGKAAVPELEKASRDQDPEVSAQATHILKIVTLRETLPPFLWKDLPGMEERLAMGGHAWTELFLESIPKDDKRSSLGFQLLKKDALIVLAGRALKEARTAKEKIDICFFLMNEFLHQEKPSIAPVVPELVKVLKDEDAGSRWSAAMALGALGASETVPEITRLLKDGDIEVRCAVPRALGWLGARESAPEITRLLRDKEVRVRSRAVEALGNLGVKDTVPEIIKLLKEDDNEVLRCTLAALLHLGAKESAGNIATLLMSERAGIRKLAVQTLGELGASGTSPEIVKLLKDEDAQVRAWSVYVLGILGARETASEIATLLRRGDAIPMGGDRIVRHWEAALRGWAALALGKFDSKETAPELQKLLKDEDADVRSSAASSLCRFGLTEGVPVFLECGGKIRTREIGYVGLGNLNAVRLPEVWAHLGKVSLSRDLEGTVHEVAEWLGREAGLQVVFPAKEMMGAKFEIRRPGGQLMSVLEGLERFITTYDNKFEVILEPDRIRILPRGEALTFWLAWWREEGKNK
jgi:HEAT repeat protein